MRSNILKAILFTPRNRKGNWGLPVLFKGLPGVGKCLAPDTPVLMFDGSSKRAADVVQGDQLMGPDSRARIVLGTTTGQDQMYRVVPIKGDQWSCNGPHVLTLAHSVTNEVVDVQLRDYLALPAGTKHYLKLFQPEGGVEFSGAQSKLPIDPYFLGVWFGDGSKNPHQVAITTIDAEIKQACDDVARDWGLVVRVDKKSGTLAVTLRLVGEDRNRGQCARDNPNALLNSLRQLVQDYDSLPRSYLIASRTDRLALLAGLIDTDGAAAQNCFEITQKREGLADDIAFLARSLGFRVTKRIKRVSGRPYYRLHIFGANLDSVPVRLCRKRLKVREQKKNALRVGFTVEPCGTGPFAGFQLDGDGRFLLGDFTVTHNSDIIESYCESVGLRCEVLSPAARGEGAFGVVPVPGEKFLHYPPPDWVETIDTEGGVVFIDEMSSCAPALQPYLLSLINDRRVGSHFLGLRVRVLGAANPTEMAAGGWDLAPPVANRQGHMQWESPSAEEWGDYMLGSNNGKVSVSLDAKEEEKRVVAAWPKPWVKAAAAAAAFMRRRSELLHKMPAMADGNASLAWPSHRTWEMAARAMAGAEVHGLSETETEELMTAFVGVGAASEFLKWRAEADLPDPADLLDGKVSFEHDKRRLDRSQAVTMACAAFVATPAQEKKAEELRQKRAAACWRLLDKCSASGGAIDVVVPAARRLADAGLAIMEAADDILAKMEPVLSAAGIKARRR